MERRIDYQTSIQVREAENGDGHTVEGIAVPFGQTIDTLDGKETFDPDTRFDGLDGAKLCYQHDDLIGSITSARSEKDGLHIIARIAPTTLGDDVAKLVAAGALDSFSVGFIPEENRVDDQGITHRRAVRLLETSLVSWPAYPAAKLTAQRGKETTKTNKPQGDTEMEDTTQKTDALNDRLDGIEAEQRSIKALMAKNTQDDQPAKLGADYATPADYIRALVHGDPKAARLMEQTRDLISTGDTGNTVTWIGDMIRLITQRRKVVNMLTTAALPQSGMSMEYNVVTNDGMAAGEQGKEADPLAFGKLTFGTVSVPIETYGGYTSLSRQVIERSTTPMLNTALTALVNAYAKATENAARNYLYGLIAAGASDGIKPGKTLDQMTVDTWTGLIVDAVEEMDDRNANIETLGVSADVFKSLASLKDGSSRALDLSGNGADNLGTFDLTSITGDYNRLPVRLFPKAPNGTAAFLDHQAVTVWESGGPTQLTAGDPTKLVDSYSVYGYMATGETFAPGLLPISFGTGK